MTSGNQTSLEISNYHGTAYNAGTTGSQYPGYFISMNSSASATSIIVNGAYVFGPLQGALYGSGATINSLSVTNAHIENTTGYSATNAAWSLGSVTNASIMGSWSHGFTAVESCAGTCTNVTLTGSFNN